jgi:hypothetical protein
MKKIWFVALFGVLIVASLACNATSKLPSIDLSTSTPEANKIVFQDDFSDTSTGWPSSTDADGIVDYDSGSYRIRVDTIGADKKGIDIWAHPGQDIKGDVRVEVDATKIGGPDSNDMGVICRYSKKNDKYNFYYFLITSDGYVAIAKMKDSHPTFISGEQMEESSAIKKTQTNHIRGDCIGKKMTLYVNDEQVATATDSDFTGGDVGLIAGTFGTTGVDIHFDDFVVRQP